MKWQCEAALQTGSFWILKVPEVVVEGEWQHNLGGRYLWDLFHEIYWNILCNNFDIWYLHYKCAWMSHPELGLSEKGEYNETMKQYELQH